ncbi:tRNA U34 5-methylaminomethyl-2-thiouridine-forming methyltransferase MnmC [Kaistella treverensis]|uniref:tRNA U34 5-methylaminomethyl-2-thiouridine-forming methyltransferase MnmC n=1 Tax=Kaistella treverensis TaxID=631455 RepID=A0A1I3JXE1_9FLAO|nr:tRNA (5-methylaminomethyl-2-thiouridine)(34)-methyltransferase MnmD [Kaistella treverensis]SFI64922.1 tRNA U34 5-methylaminomethyl-2-thiouridine-forming methyltransferase MnmC [Kaistella treverensis]
MKREIKTTSDGSNTLYINDLNESYHSHHGALQEAKHVFIENGLKLVNNCEINILELGFGTGLNVLVTINDFLQNTQIQKIHYFTLEKYPVNAEELKLLDYSEFFADLAVKKSYAKIHEAEWNVETEILPNFFLTKFKSDFFALPELNFPKIDLVYFDCFGARVQPDLWEKPLFEIVADKMADGAVLTTYSSKGSVRRILQDLNFKVEKKAGPPGKREMINAIKFSENK